jgi:hypothetical protein
MSSCFLSSADQVVSVGSAANDDDDDDGISKTSKASQSHGHLWKVLVKRSGDVIPNIVGRVYESDQGKWVSYIIFPLHNQRSINICLFFYFIRVPFHLFIFWLFISF